MLAHSPLRFAGRCRKLYAAPGFHPLLHRVFAEIRLDIAQIDRKGRDHDPSEWFVVPLTAIDPSIDLIIFGDIVDYVYDAQAQKLARHS